MLPNRGEVGYSSTLQNMIHFSRFGNFWHKLETIFVITTTLLYCKFFFEYFFFICGEHDMYSTLLTVKSPSQRTDVLSKIQALVCG
jgi:hypothetical protein